MLCQILSFEDAQELQQSIRLKLEECSEMFRLFDLNQNEYLSVSELQAVMGCLGMRITPQELQGLVRMRTYI